MDDYKELIERLRKYQRQTDVFMDDLDEAADAIESLLAENERLNHNLTSTEQTMREYQELAAKRLEEIAKYRDAPVVASAHSAFRTHAHSPTIDFEYGEALRMAVPASGKSIPLIVKPGENK